MTPPRLSIVAPPEPGNDPVAPARDRRREERLLAQMAKGEVAAMNELYALYAAPLFSYALRVLGNREDAEEVLQDAFVRLWDRASAYDSSLSQPFSWSFMIARGLCQDRLRQGQRRLRVVVDRAPVAELIVLPEVARRAEVERVANALAALPSADRRAVEMAVFLEYTGTEIAAQTSEPLGTVKSRIRRGLARLRHILQCHD